MLKSIATARTECTAKQENKASCNTDYIVPDLIDFFDFFSWTTLIAKHLTLDIYIALLSISFNLLPILSHYVYH